MRVPAGRRRRAAAIALLLALLPVRLAAAAKEGAEAQPAGPPGHVVPVTAGEHGAFSRVVFALGADRAYRTEPEPAGLRVVLPGAHVEFAYAGVYPGRRAHRVVMAEPGADADGASLRLRFGCDCSARIFRLDDRLVVDVFDAASSDSRSSSSRAAPAGRADAPAAPGHPAGAAADPAAPPQLADAGDWGQPRPEFVQRVENLRSAAPGAPPGGVPDGAGFNPDHLERMIAWAIDQGHLTGVAESDAGSPAPDAPADAQAPAAGAAVAGLTEPVGRDEQPAGPDDQPAGPAVAQEAAVAPTVAATEEAAAASGASGSCPDNAAIDMAVLGGGAFADELARRQDALSRALAGGEGIAEAQHALAGFYLARLMPHEALKLLRTADPEAATPTGRWLEAFALVLANRASAPGHRTLQASSCRGADVRLWQAVLGAADGPVPRQVLENDEIALRLAAYPADLRVELALRLAEAGIDAQAPEAIAPLLDMVDEAAPADEARARLLFLRGRLAAARGDFAAARASWREALHLQGEGGLRATLALLGWDLEHDVLDEAAALAALERLAFDWRGHPAQLSIARLTAAIHERQGRVPLALRAIEEVALGAEGGPGGRAAARLATDLMRRAYADAPSAWPLDQLAVFWRYEGFVPPGSEGADIRLAFAKALIAQGLPNGGIGLLEPLARHALGGPVHDEVIDLLAEGHLAARQPDRALDLLRAEAQAASASRPGRNLLAARALAALGRFAEAAGVLHDNPAEEAPQLQADYLWKAGLWEEASRAYGELLQAPRHADPEAAVRRAAAAYMAGERAPFGLAQGVAGIGDAEVDTSALAPLRRSDSGATPTVAAQLLDQAASLGELAQRYGLGGTQIP
jgi:hypothetical protein